MRHDDVREHEGRLAVVPDAHELLELEQDPRPRDAPRIELVIPEAEGLRERLERRGLEKRAGELRQRVVA